MGIASLVLGIISIIIGFVPLCGAIAFLPALIGLILGIIEIVKKSKSNEKKGMAIAGIVMCAVAILVIFFWVFIAAAGSGTSNTNTVTFNSSVSSDDKSITSSDTTTTNTNEPTSTDKRISVGNKYEGNDLSITYLSLDDNFTDYSRYASVKSGYKVIKAEFELENLRSSDQVVSSFDFDCFADGYDCDNFYYADDSSFSATLSKGKKIKGSVYFEVPEDADEITIEYSLNYWLSSRVEFKVK